MAIRDTIKNLKTKVSRFIGLLILTVTSACDNGTNMKLEEYFTKETAEIITVIQKLDEVKARRLLANQRTLNLRGEHGITPLFWLIMKENLAAIELALTLGADPNYSAMVEFDRSGPKPEFPLAAVAGSGNNDIFELLLKYKASPDSTNKHGQPVLFTAVGHNNKIQQSLLFKYNVNLDKKDKSNKNSLLYASYLNKYEFVYNSILKGGKFSEPDTTGTTIAWNLHHDTEKKLLNSELPSYEWVIKTKALLIEKGVEFPPLSPQEVREKLSQN